MTALLLPLKRMTHAPRGQIDHRLRGCVPADVLLYSTENHDEQKYVRNPDCWVADIDLTSIPVASSETYDGISHFCYGGTLVTPRHALLANHFQLGVGATVRWVTTNNTVVERTISATARVSTTDIFVVKLDSDVPETISPAKILPAYYEGSYLFNADDPCLTISLRYGSLYPNNTGYQPDGSYNNRQKAGVANIGTYIGGFLTLSQPILPRLQFYEYLIAGDSGKPCFLVVNGELTLLGVWLGGMEGSCNLVPYYKNQINATLAALGGGYNLTEIEL